MDMTKLPEHPLCVVNIRDWDTEHRFVGILLNADQSIAVIQSEEWGVTTPSLNEVRLATHKDLQELWPEVLNTATAVIMDNEVVFSLEPVCQGEFLPGTWVKLDLHSAWCNQQVITSTSENIWVWSPKARFIEEHIIFGVHIDKVEGPNA